MGDPRPLPNPVEDEAPRSANGGTTAAGGGIRLEITTDCGRRRDSAGGQQIGATRRR